MLWTRREVGKLALSALPAVYTVRRARAEDNVAANGTEFGGVNVGIIAPYALRGVAENIDDIVQAIAELRLHHVELQAEPVEAFAGAPARRRGPRPDRRRRGPRSEGEESADARTARGEAERPRGAGRRRGRGRAPLTSEEIAARRAAGEEMRNWRLSQPMDKFAEVKQKFQDADIAIDIVKFGLGPDMADEEIDYCFQVAKTLGCGAITCEPPVSETRRIGKFAEKHRIRVGYHNHSDATSVESFCRPGAWEQAFFYSNWNCANVDVGHFCAGNSMSPVEFIRMYHDRITNLHLKDRKFDQGPNMPWGEGNTPLTEILQLLKREQYRFMATIELEYPVPEGSDVMTELKKCVEFCRSALA
jgi:sugar phosphate isomerase/epimerase